MKLSGFQRVGVVLSVLWLGAATVSALFTLTQGASEYGLYRAWYELPWDAFTVDYADDGKTRYPTDLRIAFLGFAKYAIAPICAAWLLAAIRPAIRWIAAGFKGKVGTNGEG